MKNQISRFLNGQTGGFLDDLLLLVAIIITVVAMGIIAGLALATGIGLIAGLVIYVKYLCKLWREGKKGWFWIHLSIIATIVIIVSIPLSQVIEQKWETHLAYKTAKQIEETVRELRKKEFERNRQQTPYNLVLIYPNGSPEPEGNELFFILEIKPEDWYAKEYLFPYDKICYTDNIRLGSLEKWKFNNMPFEVFAFRNNIVVETFGQWSLDWAELQTDSIRFISFGLHQNDTKFYKIRVRITGSDSKSLRKICIPLEGDRFEKLLCTSW